MQPGQMLFPANAPAEILPLLNALKTRTSTNASDQSVWEKMCDILMPLQETIAEQDHLVVNQQHPGKVLGCIRLLRFQAQTSNTNLSTNYMWKEIVGTLLEFQPTELIQVVQPLEEPVYGPEVNDYSSGHQLGYAQGWNAALDKLLADAVRYRKIRDANMNDRNRLEHYAGPELDKALDAMPDKTASLDIVTPESFTP